MHIYIYMYISCQPLRIRIKFSPLLFLNDFHKIGNELICQTTHVVGATLQPYSLYTLLPCPYPLPATLYEDMLAFV